MTLEYLIDESLQGALVRHLRMLIATAPDDIGSVRVVGDTGAPPRGSLDADLLIWCERSGYVLVTDDRSTMSGHLVDHVGAGHHMRGVFQVRPRATVMEVAEHLIAARHVSEPGEWQDALWWIP